MGAAQELVNHSNDQSQCFTREVAVEIHSAEAYVSDKIRTKMGLKMGWSMGTAASLAVGLEEVTSPDN